MKVLFIGDIVGAAGRNVFFQQLPFLREKYPHDILIVNGENSAHGKGITKKIYNSFVNENVDCITMGNHTFSKSEILTFIDDADRMIRPANLEPEEYGKPVRIIDYNGIKVGIYNVYGSIFMDKATADPFETMDRLLNEYPSDVVIVDIHAEATSEKYAFLRMFKDDAALIVGTHTHIQTADEQIYHGCGFICDAGMCGAFDSVLGRDNEEVIKMMVTHQPSRYTVSSNPAVLSAVYAQIDDETLRCTSIERIQIRP